jgi:hypothetical protein
LVIEPLTPSNWPAFTDLLDQGGPAFTTLRMVARLVAEGRWR